MFDPKIQRRRKIILWSVAGALVLVLGTVVWWRYFRSDAGDSTRVKKTSPAKTPSEALSASPLDGVEYAENLATRIPLGVMIENHLAARPQVGLDKAGVVYEAIAEGGITRFLALFGPKDATKVGPVRSARTYYVDWNWEYNALYAHVGGNIDALQKIKKEGVRDLDEFANAGPYHREPRGGVATEHTMFANLDLLWDVGKQKGYPATGDYQGLVFKKEATVSPAGTLKSVMIPFSTKTYEVKWVYDAKNNVFNREQAGVAHKDGVSDTQFTAKNVIVQTVNSRLITTEINETGFIMDTVGSGPALVFQDGKKIEATWKKDNTKARTLFYDKDNQLIKMNPGVTWFEIINPSIKIVTE